MHIRLLLHQMKTLFQYFLLYNQFYNFSDHYREHFDLTLNDFFTHFIREAAKNIFFTGPATKKEGEGGKGRPHKEKKTFFESREKEKNVATQLEEGATEKRTFLRLPSFHSCILNTEIVRFYIQMFIRMMVQTKRRTLHPRLREDQENLKQVDTLHLEFKILKKDI